LLDAKIDELDNNQKVPNISIEPTMETMFHHYLEFQGNVSTKNLLVLYPEYAGILTDIKVTEGQKVSKGQLLATIDDGGLNQQLAQLEIQRDLSKTAFERQDRLWKDKIGSEMQYLQAKSTYEAQDKAVSQLQEQIKKTRVIAPFNGIVDEVITEKGALVSPGQSPLIRVVNLNEMYIETAVPENYIASVKQGRPVEVEFPVIGISLETVVGAVANYINPANRTFKIEVPLPNKEKLLKPNLTAKIKINDYTNEKALLVPQSIISENSEGVQYIYIIEGKKGKKATAKKVEIETGLSQDGMIEVLKGLKSGDELIIEGARSVRDGQEVNILK
jgi:RND family efflux transporter MFP subunit